jgi:cytosine/uracil/thiamine/allantoin permease
MALTVKTPIGHKHNTTKHQLVTNTIQQNANWSPTQYKNTNWSPTRYNKTPIGHKHNTTKYQLGITTIQQNTNWSPTQYTKHQLTLCLYKYQWLLCAAEQLTQNEAS